MFIWNVNGSWTKVGEHLYNSPQEINKHLSGKGIFNHFDTDNNLFVLTLAGYGVKSILSTDFIRLIAKYS